MASSSAADATAIDAKVARTDTRMVIVDAFERKLESLRMQSEAIDEERELVLRELRELRERLGEESEDELPPRGAGSPAGAPASTPVPVAPVSPLALAASSRHPVSQALTVDAFDTPWSQLGDSIALHVSPTVEEHVLTAWRVCAGLGSELRCVALGAEGELCAIIVHAEGQSWTSGLPDMLSSALHTRTLTSPAVRATHVAMGTDERYYVRYTNGVHDWVASDECSAAIESKPPAQLAFGAEWGSFCALFQDGSVEYARLPPGLEAELERRGAGDARLKDVALGPVGEWWLLYADGSSRWGGLSDALMARLHTLHRTGGMITALAFGADGTFVLRYAKGSPAVRALWPAAHTETGPA